MVEYDCTTTSIGRKEVLSPPSANCLEDFEHQFQLKALPATLRNFAAATILVVAGSSVVLGECHLPAATSAPTSGIIVGEVEQRTEGKVSFREARRMARELQTRIDTEYQRLLERDAEVEAIWEEGE